MAYHWYEKIIIKIKHFMNTNQKIFGGIALAGIIGIIAYKKMSKPSAAASAAPATTNTTTASFTGNDDIYSNYTGYINADGVVSKKNKCDALMNALANTRKQLQNRQSLPPSKVTALINSEMNMLGQLQKMGCNDNF